MKSKKIFLFIAVLVTLTLLVSLKPRFFLPKVCFDNSCVNVEIADEDSERGLGLMYRESLGKDRGMFFVFSSEDYHSMWMRNMNFPIDIVWFDKNLEVVYVRQNVSPCTLDPCPIYKPEKKAMYVLEVNANYTVRNNIVVGTSATFKKNLF